MQAGLLVALSSLTRPVIHRPRGIDACPGLLLAVARLLPPPNFPHVGQDRIGEGCQVVPPARLGPRRLSAPQTPSC
jgi:hypothetical protein